MIIFWMPYLSVIQLFCSAWYYFWINPCIDIDINHTGLKCQYRHLPTYMWPAPKTLTCSKTSTSSRIFMAYMQPSSRYSYSYIVSHRSFFFFITSIKTKIIKFISIRRYIHFSLNHSHTVQELGFFRDKKNNFFRFFSIHFYKYFNKLEALHVVWLSYKHNTPPQKKNWTRNYIHRHQNVTSQSYDWAVHSMMFMITT